MDNLKKLINNSLTIMGLKPDMDIKVLCLQKSIEK